MVTLVLITVLLFLCSRTTSSTTAGRNVSAQRNLVSDEEFGLIVGKLVADR
jgi:hypothetical protein